MNYHNNKLFNRDLKLAINLAIKIKHQHDKSKNNPRDYPALQSFFTNVDRGFKIMTAQT